MPIRKRTAVSNPVAFNEDQAIRIALRHGIAALQRERVELLDFPPVNDKEAMRIDRQLAYLERLYNNQGNLSIKVSD